MWRMTSKGKEIYNTIKRSLSTTSSSVLNGLGPSGSGHGGNQMRYIGGSSNNKRWIHPSDILLNGRVEYSLKMLGFTEVSEPKGTQVVRDAIRAIRFQLQVNRGITGHSGAKLKKVDLQISVDGLTVIDSKTKMILHKYPLHKISFCADDKQDKRVFSFIANADGPRKHECFVFLSEKLAEQITLTVGEAFDLAYQRFLEKNGRDLENRKQIIALKKRVVELEAENKSLREQLAVALKFNKTQQEDAPVPSLPSSPMPREPPPGLTVASLGTGDKPSSSFPVPVIPPPPPSLRKAHNGQSTTRAILNEVGSNHPEIGPKLENLHVDKIEDIYDDDFDPRADERKRAAEEAKKDKFGLDPFGEEFISTKLNGEQNMNSEKEKEEEPTAEQYEKMLDLVDKKLDEMREGFALGRLSVGDTGDSARDFQNAYATLPGSMNQDASHAKESEAAPVDHAAIPNNSLSDSSNRPS
ncbi:hypothetical protein AB6A40_006687 [Gnathostoma spinigerum]|uniref:PID domain-containing protein n=1 Tax=Gnathostoma spinigerum TaxID=75299 RepID=A0ABD6ESH3_9BILA